MKKFLAGVLIVLSSITFSGCSLSDTQSAAVDLISSAVVAEEVYSNGNVVDYIDSPLLSEDDIDRIIVALTIIDEEREALEFYKDNPKMLLADAVIVDYSFVRIKEAYLDIKEVVVSNKDLYSPDKLKVFKNFDTTVTTLSIKYEGLKDAIASNKAATTVLTIANIALKAGGVAL